MKKILILVFCFLSTLVVSTTAPVNGPPGTITTVGAIGTPLNIDHFNFRIADFMADILPPNFDDNIYTTQWQGAFDDLVASSPNKEINYVQIRIWWKIDIDGGAASWINPTLGSDDPGQSPLMTNDNWKRWLFGSPQPTYGPSAAERIHQAGLHMQLAISGAWLASISDPAKPPLFRWGGQESSDPTWVALGGGETFLDNYYKNVIRPVAEFLASSPNFIDGDVLGLSFEMNYPTADFTWSHNSKWSQIIADTKQIFRNAGKNIYLTLDHCGFYDDQGLGYNAVKLLNPSAPISTSSQGMSGASYLRDLDFISISWWLPLVLENQVPTTWTDADISWVANSWFNNLNFERVGTGYGGVPRVAGRNFMADLAALSQIMGDTPIMLNTGWENRHNFIATAPRRSSTTPDPAEQRVAWAAQIRALSNQTWAAGQDFERYCRDKAAQPTYMDTSWRASPAQQAIVNEITTLLYS